MLEYLKKFLNTEKPNVNLLAINNRTTHPELRNWVTQNIKTVKSISKEFRKQLEELIYEAKIIGLSHKSFAKQLVDSFGIPKKKAIIIARDQINKLNGNLTRVRNLELDITEYKWSTSIDDRVRHFPAVLESKICSWEM